MLLFSVVDNNEKNEIGENYCDIDDFNHYDDFNDIDDFNEDNCSPVDFRFSNLHTDFGILHWQQPEDLAEVIIIAIIIIMMTSIISLTIFIILITNNQHLNLQTVTDYVVNFKKISPQMGDLEKVNNAQSPFILEVES